MVLHLIIKIIVSLQLKVRKISPQKQSSKTSSSTTTTNDSGHPPPSKPNENSLLSGSYDEEESAASFQQALEEWRAAGNATNAVQAYTTKGIYSIIDNVMLLRIRTFLL